ncbi:MAG: GNAT family N-acetyltransferase [Oscillospiraceae bacterium]|nr:GNAT family N-acetyltransferase [Oscillospiraceae bacterium]
MIVRKALPEEYASVNALFSIAFEAAPSAGPAQENDTDVRHWCAFSDEGELMSSLSLTPFTIRFDGCACPMAGVGAVATLPPFRRKGGVAACFAEALPELYRDGVVFSYLYPFSTAFYRRFGYESCVTKLNCTLELAQLKRPAGDGYFRLATKEAPLADDIRKVDRAWEDMWNMEVLRDDGDYEWITKLDPLTSKEYLYVCYDASGEPLGYTEFHTQVESDGRNLICSRLRFTGREGFRAVLGVFGSHAADYRFAKFSLPSDDALPYLMGEWSLGAASFSLLPAGMVRIVNATEALRRAVCRGEGELSLRLRDAQIAENNGVFTVRFAGGHTVSVEKTDREPDAVLDIASFSALLAGVCELPGAARWMDGVEIIRPEAPLDSLLYRKPMMISEYF